MIGYSVVLVLLLGLFSVLLATRKDIGAAITRAQGQLYQQPDSLHYSNLYTIKLINKTVKDVPVTLRLEDISGEIKMVTPQLKVTSESMAEGTFFVILSPEQILQRSMDIRVGVYSGDKKIETVKTKFFGPVLQ